MLIDNDLSGYFFGDLVSLFFLGKIWIFGLRLMKELITLPPSKQNLRIIKTPKANFNKQKTSQIIYENACGIHKKRK